MFGELGITIDPVRALVVERLGPGSEQPIQGQLPFSALAKEVLEVARREALSVGSEHIDTEHLLLGIVRTDCGACQILQPLGADAGSVRGRSGNGRGSGTRSAGERWEAASAKAIPTNAGAGFGHRVQAGS